MSLLTGKTVALTPGAPRFILRRAETPSYYWGTVVLLAIMFAAMVGWVVRDLIVG